MQNSKYLLYRSKSQNLLAGLLILSSLFLTTKSFYVFYGVILLILSLLIVSHKPRKFDLILLFFLIFIFSFSFFRMFVFSGFDDFKEILKFFIFVLIVWLRPSINSFYIFKVFFVFSILNFFFSLMQFIHFDYFGIVSSLSQIYNADKHIDASLSYVIPRALGFSSGPGQQAVLSVFFIAYFFVILFFSKGYKYLSVVGVFICLFTLMMTQSKTAIIAIPISIFIFYISCFRMFSFYFKLLIFLFLFFISFFVFFSLDMIFDRLPELKRVYDYGLDVSSFQDRIENWKLVFSPMFKLDNIFIYLFGIGRSALEYYGVNDIPYDSDYVYVAINFGFFGLAMFFLFLMLCLIYPLISGVSRPKVMFFSMVSSFSLVISFSLNFYIEPRVYILFAFFLASNDNLFRPFRVR